MNLSSDLISQFAKITKDEKKRNVESTLYGTIVTYDGSFYVRLDGSDLLTPIVSTAEVREGERVTVLLKNHSATVIGNISSPAAGTEIVTEISTETVSTLISSKASIKDLDTERARINSLVANDVTISERLTANEADIIDLETANVTVTNTLNAHNAEIETLKADKLDVDTARLYYATIENLDAANANITSLQTNKLDASEAAITYATIAQLDAMDIDVEKLSAISADIDDLKATKLDASVAAITYATIEQLNSVDISTETLSAINAEIDDLKTSKLDADEAAITYANIDFTNIGKAAMEYFYANSGLIQNVVVGDATITGNLVGVTINGDLIEANTLVADRLIIQGEDGLYYALNTDGVSVEAEQTDYNSLDGSVIKAQSITATKINVDDLVAFDATIGGFNITESSLYSGVKESVDNTTRGVYLDNDGQMAFGDANRYVKYYQDTDDTYKLDICADGVKFAATGTDLASGVYGIVSGPSTIEMREDIDALEVRVTDAETKIEQNSEAITLSATKTEVATAKSEAISAASSDATTKANNALASANANTTDLLKSYSTTADMNSAIELKADSITNTVSATYATKTQLEETKTDVNALDVRLLDAETKVEQNAEAITLRATKTEVDDALTGYYTKEQSDAALTVSANNIISNVSNTYATKSALSETQSDVDSLTDRIGAAETTITQNADAIALRATKTEMAAAKSEAISTASSDATTKANNALSNANANVANLLKNYSTTAEMNAAIELESDSITSAVSTTYATKNALAETDAVAVKARDDIASLDEEVATNYATKSEVTQTANNITSSVSSTYATKNALATTDANVTAAQDDIDALDTRVASAESSITILANSIATNVTEITNLGTRTTTVEQTASGLTTRLTTAETNITNAAKTATDYLNLSTAGLVVGQNPTNPTAGNTLISTDGVTIRKGTTVLSEFKAATRTASGITSATISSSDITDSESDGVTSVSGTVKRNESRANVYISTNGNPVYFPNGIETDKVLINDNGIISNDNILLDGSIVDSSGEGIFTPLNSYGNTIIGYGRYQDGGGTHVYGARVKAKTKSGFSASVNGVAAIETDNSSGNATFGWHHYNASEGETTIYGNIVGLASKEDIRINSSGNHIRFDGNIVPYTTNKYNLGNPSLAIRDIHISSVNDGTAHGISFSSGSGSDNAVGVNASGYRIFGNTSYCTNIVTKSTTTTNTGYSFKITCGDNPTLVIGDNDARLFLFGGTDTTSRYIGSMAAYKRTYTASANMCVTENGIIGRVTSSSERYKKDIDIASIDELKGLYDLPVKKFKYRDGYIADDDELYDKYLYGFIVEDLETILPCAVQHITDENGEKLPEMWNSNILVPSLFKLVQDLNNRLKIIEMGG